VEQVPLELCKLVRDLVYGIDLHEVGVCGAIAVKLGLVGAWEECESGGWSIDEGEQLHCFSTFIRPGEQLLV